MRLSRKTLLALEAVVDVAVNARPDPIQSRDITERQGIPQRYLEQVLQRLVKAGILKGVRGPRGGYSLARERRRISVADVMRVVEAMDEEAEKETRPASDLARQVIMPIWEDVQTDMVQRLSAISIEDLCNRCTSEGILGQPGKPTDFTI